MANYFNKLGYTWTLVEKNKTYRIVPGMNKGLPDGLDVKHKDMLRLAPEPIIPAVPVPPPPPVPTNQVQVPDFTIGESPKNSSIEAPGVDVNETPKTNVNEPSAADPKKEALTKLKEQYEAKLAEINASDKTKRSRNASIQYWDKWLKVETEKIEGV